MRGRDISRDALAASLSPIFTESRSEPARITARIDLFASKGADFAPSAGRDRFLRKASGIVSRIRARCRRTRPRSCALRNFPSLCMQATGARSHKGEEGSRVGKSWSIHPSLSSLSLHASHPFASLTLLSPSDSRFFSSPDLPRVTRARYYIGRSVGRSLGCSRFPEKYARNL